MKATLLTGGWAHPAEQSQQSLTATLARHGLETNVVTSPKATAAEIGQPDLLVVNACWFSMTDARYDADQRAEFAVGRDVGRERILQQLAETGTPILALHTAVLCFDGWEWWSDVLGGAWDWEMSGHPPPGPLEVLPVGQHSLLAAPFQVIDEEYQGLAFTSDNELVAESAAGHPLVWTRTTPARVAVSLLGHDERSLDNVNHQTLVSGLVTWLMDTEESTT